VADPVLHIYSELSGFPNETVTGSGSTTYAYVYSTSNASFTGDTAGSMFTLDGETSTVNAFPQVYVVGAEDASDHTTLHSSGGGFVGTPSFSYVSGTSHGSSFIIGALYCANVMAQATNATDSAYFYSYPGDTFTGAVGTSSLTGSASGFASFSTFVSQAIGFQSVAVLESGGATDAATLTSPGDGTFNETPTVSTLIVNSITVFTINTYVISGGAFIAVPSQVNITGNPDGSDTANLDDAPGSNALVVGGNKATLATQVSTVGVTQFSKVNAIRQNGASNTVRMAAAIDFVLSDPGWTSV
jgi:hypothetical protein